MEKGELLKQLWMIQATQNNERGDACRFQLQSVCGAIEYYVCSTAVLLDYAPKKTLEPGKLFKVGDLPLKKLQDASKVNPDVFLCEESVMLNDDLYLDNYFLPLNGVEDPGLGIFEIHDDKAVLRSVLPYTKTGNFQFAGLAFTHIPVEVQTEINNQSSMRELHGRICKVRTNPMLALVLTCDTAMLVVTLAKIRFTNPANENIYFDKECKERYKLDCYRDDLGVFNRLVPMKGNNMKGLANPVARNKVAEQTAPVEAAPTPSEAAPQVEEVQPEQAEEIAAAAPEVQAEMSAPVEATPAPAEEPKKRTRVKRTVEPSAGDDALDKALAYVNAPLPEGMNTDMMRDEIRKMRDLMIACARRQANLFTAATASEKKLRDVLRGVLG